MASSTTATIPAWEPSQEQEVEKRQQEISTPPSDDYEKESTQVPEQQPEEEHNWATGIQLLTIMAAITLVCFLMLLDTSIIVTVNSTTLKQSWFLTNKIGL